MNGDLWPPHIPASNQDEELHLDDMDIHDYAEAQENLSHASHGLTDALHRLQQLRNSLASLTDRLPPHDPQVHGSNQGVGPAHAAIVLSDSTTLESNVVPDMHRLRSTIPSTIMERLEEYETDSRRHSESTGRRFASTLRTPVSRQSSNSQLLSSSTQTTASRTRPTYRAPPFPDLVLPPRPSWAPRRRDANPDDSSTALGRRVAARAAAGGPSSSENHIPQLDQIFLSRTTEIARDLETAVNRLASHRAARLEQRTNEVSRNATSNNHNGATPAIEGRVSGHIGDQIPNRPTNSTSARTFRYGQIAELIRTASSEPEDAAPSVTTTLGPRSRRLFREDPDRPLSGSARTAAERARDPDNRNYLVRRRLNADGDEHVHNIHSMDWDDDSDDPMEWLMPPLTSHAHNHLDARILPSRVSRNISPLSPSVRSYRGSGPPRGHGSSQGADYIVDDIMHESIAPEVPRRRRGWGKSGCSLSYWILWLISSCPARLDADGNEVTTEAEDEIERAHTRSRVRALAQVRASASSATSTLSPIELGAARRETLVPMTRTSITHAWNDEDGVTARVRINRPQQMPLPPFTPDAIYLNGIPSESPISSHSDPRAGPIHDSHGCLDTLVVDPLPMPLADMISYPPTLHKSYPKTVNVHKYADLAGR
jgi:hypothetical protein